MCQYGGNSKRLCKVEGCEDCYFRSFASSPHVKLWIDTSNELKPYQVFISSAKKINFYCGDCKHYFISSPNYLRDKKIGCPYCVYPTMILCNDENCGYCKERSFSSSDKAKYWSVKNKISPRKVSKCAKCKYYFDCNVCKHTFLMSPHIISKGCWCGYCGRNKLCEDECKICEEKSFKSHPRSKNLSSKNKISARFLNLNSSKKCIFDCECGHEFEAIISNVVNGSWCPYCCIPTQKLCPNINCNQCLTRSLANHPKSIYICKENNLDPRQITLNSHMEISFICNDCNSRFESKPYRINAGQWCPTCVNKTEKIIFDFLQEKNVKFHYQYSAEWTKNPETNQHFKIDYFLPEHNLALELDGAQHFRQVSDWTSNEKTRERDVTKMLMAYKQGITTMRILQEDVFFNRRDWKRDLSRLVLNYTPAGVIMVSNENEYSQHYLDFVKVTNEPNRCFMFK